MTTALTRRWIVLALAVCLLTLPAGLLNKPAEVRAWSNGEYGPNDYGTHDWILDRAITAIRHHNKKAHWVDFDVAQSASDDPDSRDGIEYASSPWWHVYDVHGERYGNAPKAIRFWFKKAAKQLAGKHRRKASRSLGILSHLLANLANPMYTGRSSREDRIRSSYEEAVNRGSDYRFHYDGSDSGKPGRKAKHVAAVSHRFYKSLVRSYDRNGYSPRVHRITKRQLNRAINAVVDVAAAIKAAARRQRRHLDRQQDTQLSAASMS